MKNYQYRLSCVTIESENLRLRDFIPVRIRISLVTEQSYRPN